MNIHEEHRPCSITACSLPAVEHEAGGSEHWHFTVFYCQEHAREIRKGVPVGPVGLDLERILIEPVGTSELRPPAFSPVPPEAK